MSFALEIKNKYNNLIKIGITTGNVFAGIIGNELRSTYTVLGDNVNMAARLMSMAKWGDIFICENTGMKIHGKFEVDYMGTFSVKGKKNSIPVYSLKRKIKIINEFLYENQFIGREKEKSIIKKIINRHNIDKNILLYISGPAGIGKSRLIS